jgi:hypothetical protein
MITQGLTAWLEHGHRLLAEASEALAAEAAEAARATDVERLEEVLARTRELCRWQEGLAALRSFIGACGGPPCEARGSGAEAGLTVRPAEDESAPTQGPHEPPEPQESAEGRHDGETRERDAPDQEPSPLASADLPNGTTTAPVSDLGEPPPPPERADKLADKPAGAPPRRPPEEALEGLLSRARDFCSRGDAEPGDAIDGKALACWLRAWKAFLPPDDPRRAVVADEIAELERAFKAMGAPSRFLAFRRLELGQARWERLGRAFTALAWAQRAVDWMDDGSALDAGRQELGRACAAAAVWVHRLTSEPEVNWSERSQKALHDRLRRLLKGTVVPCWRNGQCSDEETGAAAESVRPLFEKALREKETRDKREAAWRRWRETLEGRCAGSFEEDLIEATAELLAHKVPPSQKELVGALTPYRHLFGEDRFRALRRALDREAVRHKDDVLVDHEPPMDAELRAALDRARAFLTGKTLLFVGGNKGQGPRRDDYKKAFGLKDFHWPELEDHSHSDEAAKWVRQADVVAYLIRFSRHRYKAVVDEAKRQGKTVVVLTAGLSVNRFAYELDRQALSAAHGPSGAVDTS